MQLANLLVKNQEESDDIFTVHQTFVVSWKMLTNPKDNIRRYNTTITTIQYNNITAPLLFENLEKDLQQNSGHI